MKNTLIQSISLWILILAPYIYLFFQYESMPDQMPMHYNINGEIDRWGSKENLWLLPCALPLFVYILMLVIPKIDPKKKLQYMGTKYRQFHLMLLLFMSALAIFIMHDGMQGESSVHFINVLMGLLFVGLGNYFQSIRPNYFIGIRTPWTLENDETWNATHRMAGKLWIVGGIIIVLSTLLINEKPWHSIILFSMIGTMVIIPIVYSYLVFKKSTSKPSSQH